MINPKYKADAITISRVIKNGLVVLSPYAWLSWSDDGWSIRISENKSTHRYILISVRSTYAVRKRIKN